MGRGGHCPHTPRRNRPKQNKTSTNRNAPALNRTAAGELEFLGKGGTFQTAPDFRGSTRSYILPIYICVESPLFVFLFVFTTGLWRMREFCLERPRVPHSSIPLGVASTPFWRVCSGSDSSQLLRRYIKREYEEINKGGNQMIRAVKMKKM